VTGLTLFGASATVIRSTPPATIHAAPLPQPRPFTRAPVTDCFPKEWSFRYSDPGQTLLQCKANAIEIPLTRRAAKRWLSQIAGQQPWDGGLNRLQDP